MLVLAQPPATKQGHRRLDRYTKTQIGDKGERRRTKTRKAKEREQRQAGRVIFSWVNANRGFGPRQFCPSTERQATAVALATGSSRCQLESPCSCYKLPCPSHYFIFVPVFFRASHSPIPLFPSRELREYSIFLHFCIIYIIRARTP